MAVYVWCVVCVDLYYLYVHVCNTGSPHSRTLQNDFMVLYATLCVSQPMILLFSLTHSQHDVEDKSHSILYRPTHVCLVMVEPQVLHLKQRCHVSSEVEHLSTEPCHQA